MRRNILLKTFHYLVRKRGWWIRSLFCWAIGLSILLLVPSSNHDNRFQLRGEQPVDHRIVIITFDRREWSRLIARQRNWTKIPSDIFAPADSFFWDPTFWADTLGKILAHEPAAVGITLFFDEGFSSGYGFHNIFDHNLTHPKVIWAAQRDLDGRALIPHALDGDSSRAGLVELRVGNDGRLRRFVSSFVQIPHQTVRMLQTGGDITQPLYRLNLSEPRLINFRGNAHSFSRVSIYQLMSGQVPKDFLKNKYVILGVEGVDSHTYLTPIGKLNRAEVFANVIDNFLQDRWISQFPQWVNGLYLLVLTIVCVSIMAFYPQSVALGLLFWVATAAIAVSVWVFDSLYIWIPALAPMIQILAIYIVFLSFQLTVKEYLNWRLEQQKTAIFELEQLKNNFVSLISHDLKTPIAKLQAICDRLLSQTLPSELAQDIQLMRMESVQLHRYIQSILQVSRVESQDIKISREAHDINEVVEEVVNQLRSLAQQKNITLECSLEPLFSVEIDEILIREVILNLIENAIKYSYPNGHVSITSKEKEDRVYITVTDDGPGMDKPTVDKIFEKFYRGEVTNLSTKGSGLGLYLVKYFIELHGGEVFVDSAVGKGTTIGFSLPLSQESTNP